MATSTTQRAFLFIARELVGELIYFPVWWYSVGLFSFGRMLWREWRLVTERLAIRILAQNMFRPMYADYTRSGRVISFFFRLVIIGVRLVVLALWTMLELVFICFWILVPLMAISLLIRQAFPI